MLGIERDARIGQRGCDPLLDGAQRAHRGEQAQRAAAGRQEQFAERRSDLIDIAPIDVLHHEDAGLRAVFERRAEAGALRRLGQVAGPGAHLGRLPVVDAFSPTSIPTDVAQRCRCDQRAMRRRQHMVRQRDRRIDPVPLKPHVEIASVLARDLEPVDKLLAALAFELVEHLGPGRHHELAAPDEAARRRLDARARIGL